MKKLMVSLLVILGLSGCVSSPYVTEAQMNKRAQQVIEQYQLRSPLTANLPNTEVLFDIKQAKVDLQSANGGQMVLNLDGSIKGTVSILGIKRTLSVPFSPQLVSPLRYDEGNIYLNSPSVLNWGDKIPPMIADSIRPFENVISLYLQQVPIYTLDHSLEEKIAAKIIRKIKIQDDKLILVP